MSCELTQGINLDCRDSIGGLQCVYLIPFDSVTLVTAAAGTVSAITKITDAQFYKYNMPKQTGIAEETADGSEANGAFFWNTSIKFPINKMSVSVRNELMIVAQSRLMAVTVDMNGQAWLYGSKNALVLNTGTKSTTGTALGDRNGYELEFIGAEKDLALAVSDACVLTLETPGT